MRAATHQHLPAAVRSRLVELSAEPRELFAWISSGDPLGLQARVLRAIRDEAILVDVERVLEKLRVHVARDARAFGRSLDLPGWVDARTRAVCWRLLEADALEYSRNPGWQPPRTAELCLLLALPPERLMPAIRDFHRLDFPVRQAFFELLIKGKSPLQLLGEGLGPAWLLRDRCARAMQALYLTEEEKAMGKEGWQA